MSIDFGSRAAANFARDKFEIEGDRRFKSLDIEGADLDEPDLDRLVGMAAEARLDRADAGGQAALTEAEKAKIDFSEVDYFSAASAKASLKQQGVEDWISVFDQSLTVGENKGMVGGDAQRRLNRQLKDMGRAAAVGRTAARDPTGKRDRGMSEATDESVARGFQRFESGLASHAVEGARRGSAKAKAQLRRMGWSESDIREIMATGQVGAALTPGQTVRLSGGLKVTPRQWAKAKRSHEHRRVRSQYVDEARKAPVTTDFEKWRRNPHRYDYPGVDTRRPLRSYFDDEGRYESFRGLTDDLWKWQTGGDNRL